MKLNKLIFINNACYKAGQKIKVKGIMVHSTGVNNPDLKRYVGPDDGKLGKNIYNNHWNQPMDRGVCVHAFIGKLADCTIATYQTLPWDHRGWHAGGRANDSHVSFEICEDGLNDAKYFNAVYKEAIELCAYLCNLYTLDPLKDGVIIGHYEGHQRGLASNHGDPRHWFSRFNKSMDAFRNDVKALMKSSVETKEELPEKTTGDLYRVRKSWDDKKSQIGAFKVLANAKKKADEKPGYFVFDSKGTAIYPTESKKEAEKTPVINLVHTVVSGDSLWSIAKKYLGDGTRFEEIKDLNGLTNNIIRVGMKLKIPGESIILQVGDKVKITATRYSTGEIIPDWVKKKEHVISQLEKEKALLGWPDGISSWVPLTGISKA